VLEEIRKRAMGNVYEDEDIEIVSEQLESGKFGHHNKKHRNGYSSDENEDDDDANSLISNKKNMRTASSILFGRKDKLTINDVELYPLPSDHHERKMKAQGRTVGSPRPDEDVEEPQIQVRSDIASSKDVCEFLTHLAFEQKDDIAKWSVLKEKYTTYNLFMMLCPTGCGITGLSGFGIAIYLMTNIPEVRRGVSSWHI